MCNSRGAEVRGGQGEGQGEVPRLDGAKKRCRGQRGPSIGADVRGGQGEVPRSEEAKKRCRGQRGPRRGAEVRGGQEEVPRIWLILTSEQFLLSEKFQK